MNVSNFTQKRLEDLLPQVLRREHIEGVNYHISPKKVSFSFSHLPNQIFTYFYEEQRLRQAVEKIEEIKQFCLSENLNLICPPQYKLITIPVANETCTLLKLNLGYDPEINTPPSMYLGYRFSERYPFYQTRAADVIKQMALLILKKGYIGEFTLIGSVEKKEVKAVLLNPDALTKYTTFEAIEDAYVTLSDRITFEHFQNVHTLALKILPRKFGNDCLPFLEKVEKETIVNAQINAEENYKIRSFYEKYQIASSHQLVLINTEELMADDFFKDWDISYFSQRETLGNASLRRLYFVRCAKIIAERIHLAIKENHEIWGLLGDRSLDAFKKLRRIRITISDINFHYKKDCYEGEPEPSQQNLLSNVLDKLQEKGLFYEKLPERLSGDYLRLQC